VKMPVLAKKDEGTELVELDLNEVLYINIEDRNIVYHTIDNKYYQITKLSELDEHLFELGFDLLDKTNLVNMNKVMHFDSRFGKIFFEASPSRTSKFASVAAIQQKLRKHQISRAIANNSGSLLEYTMKDKGSLLQTSTKEVES
jgi:DNA-binding LytR/AlgR family response regulator